MENEKIQKLVEQNLGLVRKVAWQYCAIYAPGDKEKQRELYEDFFQEGVMGLMESLSRFDETRGYKLSTYAIPWIRMRISKYAEVNLQPGQVTDSLQEKVYEDNEAETKEDRLEDPNPIVPSEVTEKSIMAEKIREVVATLDPQERHVVELHFGLTGGEPMPFRDIGPIIGVSGQRAQQVLIKALKKLRVRAKAAKIEAPD